jgi:hypothetical protein
MSLEIDTTGDIRVEGGNVFLLTGIDATRQNLENRLKTFKGEWFLDPDLGLPFFDDIKKKNPDVSILNAIFTAAILETPGVVSIEKLTFEINSAARELYVNFAAITTEGETITESITV